MSTEKRVVGVVTNLLTRQKRTAPVIDAKTPLYAGGLGFDSLAAAELSTLLEMEFGKDPYSDGKVPQTIADIVGYYDAAPPANPAGAHAR